MAVILVVDDSESMRLMVTAILESQGNKVVQAKAGGEALLYAMKHSVDMVLADLNMPGMSGMGLVRKLRKLEHYEETPILMLTSETKKDAKSQARTLGASGWITKPITEERLLNAVNTVLKKCA